MLVRAWRTTVSSLAQKAKTGNARSVMGAEMKRAQDRRPASRSTNHAHPSTAVSLQQ